MNNSKRIVLYTLVLVLGLFSACKKEDPETDQQRNTRQISKAWRVSGVTLDPQEDYSLGGETVIVTFTSTGSFTIQQAGALPNMREPFQELPSSGSWQFVGNDFSRIRLTSGTTVLEATISNLTDNSMTLTYPGAEPKATDPVTVTVTLVPNN
jgi:hypothetical protein